MFNQQPFNRGKFNVNSSQAVGSHGIGLMNMKSNVLQVVKVINAIGTSNMNMKAESDGTKVLYSLDNITSMMSGGFVDGTKVFIVPSENSNMALSTQAIQVLAGEDVIFLEGLSFKPGDELIIDTCNLTVSINGQNGMKFFSNESDFFSLLNGLNTLVYEDNVAIRNISLDVIWKDRWL